MIYSENGNISYLYIKYYKLIKSEQYIKTNTVKQQYFQ